ncbi:hypothetical protein Tco_0781870 [Tanacetum coccineum]
MMRLKYTDGSLITDHLMPYQVIINTCRYGYIKFADELPRLVASCILNEETRRKSQGSSSQSDVLVTERRGRSQSRGPSNGENRKTNYNSQKNKHKKDDDGDENTEVNTTTDEFFVCYDYDMVNLANDDSSWILKSGSTCYVATRKYYYSSYTPRDFGVVRWGLLDEDGYQNSSGIGFVEKTPPFGHMSEKGMSILSKKNMLSGVHDINLKNCYHCLAGKQTRLAFKSRSPFRIENILDLVHSDGKALIAGNLEALKYG